MSVLLYTRSLDGHRASYLEFTSRLLKGKRGSIYELLRSPEPALFLMIEESFGLYLLISVWRALLQRRTVGLLFRPKPAVLGQTLRLKAKRGILKALKCLGGVKTLSIVPVSTIPGLEKLVDDWIYDFQLWDMSEQDHQRFNELSTGIGPAFTLPFLRDLSSSGKILKTVAAIGIQNHRKGFDIFAGLPQRLRKMEDLLFISGGKIDPTCQSEKLFFEAAGGVAIDRFVSDAEIIELYAASSAVWCVYSEEYDQASGILGRAIQFGIPPIVRKGSISEKFCIAEGIAHTAINPSEPDLPQIFPTSIAVGDQPTSERFKKQSIKVLQDCILEKTTSPINALSP